MATSIRRRLLVTLIAAIVTVSGTTLVLSYFDSRHEVQELFDAQLARSARVLQALLLPELLQGKQNELQALLKIAEKFPQPTLVEGEDEEENAFGHEYERKLAFQLWDNNNQLVVQSASAPQQPLSLLGLRPEHRGYRDEQVAGEHWRVFNLWDENDRFLIQVAESYEVRDELIADISKRLITPALISLPLLALLIWIGISRGLAPVQQVATEVTRRNPQHLQPMDAASVPQEIQPLVTELNDLFGQLREALEKERRFTDDAAHELRTPLASLKTQTQVALRASDEAEKQQALRQIIHSVDRANHLLEQMLTLARLNPKARAIDREDIFLYPLTAEVVAQVTPKAIKKHINVELDGFEHALVKADPISLSVLIRNLVDNAVQYTPEYGEVNVRIDNIDQQIRLSVSDSGPGIDTNLQGRVFDRFYRVLGNSATGCGLGLAIVKQIAELFDIEVELKNKEEGSGLVATLLFVSEKKF
ncbi:ATP-binding protein [Kaarinaea lacus]